MEPYGVKAARDLSNLGVVVASTRTNSKWSRGLLVVWLGLGLILSANDTHAQSFTVDSTYTAAEDGLVSASVSTGDCLGEGSAWAHQWVQGYRNDTVVAYESDWDNLRELNISYPVRRGDRWSVRVFCRNAAKQVVFTSLHQAGIGSIHERHFNREYRESRPGFIIASGYTGSCLGERSTFTYQSLTGYGLVNGSRATKAFESAWGEWRAVSITFPVAQDEPWSVQAFCPPPYDPNYGATAHLYFAEIDGSSQTFDSARLVANNHPFIAPEDGILVASAWTGACKQYGWTNQTLRILENGSPLATEQAWGEYRSVNATVSVRAGNSYEARFFCTDGPSYAQALFVPASFQARVACNDGIDNDGDRLVDLHDPGCLTATDDGERELNGPACDNGLDDDHDGLIDFPIDRDCFSSTDSSERSCCAREQGAQCEDGIDNDCDGSTDGADTDCQAQECRAGSQDSRSCSSGAENSCSTSGVQYRTCSAHGSWGTWGPCRPTAPTNSRRELQCSDGIDNDCDGLVDTHDPDCRRPRKWPWW